MKSLHKLVVVTFVIGATACVADTEPKTEELRYAGTFRVTELVYLPMGTSSASLFGKITIPSSLAPAMSVGDCNYYTGPLGGGITQGPITVTGLAEPVVVEPESYINGTFYESYLSENIVPDGAVVTAELADIGVSAVAVAPEPLASVVLPELVSRSTPVTLTWAAGGADEVAVALSVSGLGTNESIACWTADTGSYTIGLDVLSLLQIEASQATLRIGRRNRGSTASVDADLELNLVLESAAFRSVTLQ